jgi:hypothetical protein
MRFGPAAMAWRRPAVNPSRVAGVQSSKTGPRGPYANAHGNARGLRISSWTPKADPTGALPGSADPSPGPARDDPMKRSGVQPLDALTSAQEGVPNGRLRRQIHDGRHGGCYGTTAGGFHHGVLRHFQPPAGGLARPG